MVQEEKLGLLELTPIILINNIWRCYPEQNYFINKFVEVDTHETLHKVIIECLRDEMEDVIDEIQNNNL